MAVYYYTSFTSIYDSFYSKITDDMYMEFTQEDTAAMAQDLLLTAVHKFEFPRNPLIYRLNHHEQTDAEGNTYKVGAFKGRLTAQEVNILAVYMVVEWIGQQLASIELTRMKYSGADFKFTSQANHIQKLVQLKKQYQRQGFHLQRLYKRRFRDVNGIFHSTFGKIMQPVNALPPGYGLPPENYAEDYDPDGWIADGIVWNPFDTWHQEDDEG